MTGTRRSQYNYTGHSLFVYASGMPRRAFIALLCFFLSCGGAGGRWAIAGPALRVLVLDNAPPMSFRDEFGRLSGFSVDVARAVCDEMRVQCVFDVAAQSDLIDRLIRGQADIVATGLLETPERHGKLLFAKPYYRSFSMWLARPDVKPGQTGIRVAVVSESAQEEYGRRQGWKMHPVHTNGDLGGAIVGGHVQAALVPMATALTLQKSEAYRRLELSATVLRSPELGGDASFGVSLFRPELLDEINAALERIKRNGTYDRINSRYLPFRVS